MHTIDHHLYHHHLPHLLLFPFLLGSCPCYYGRLPGPLKASLLYLRVPSEVSRGSQSVFSGVSPPAYYFVHQYHLGISHPSCFVQLLTLVPNILCQYWTTCKSLMCTIPWGSKTLLLHRNHARSDHLSSDAAFLLLWVSFILSMELNICPWGLVKINILNTHHSAFSIPLPSLLLHTTAPSLALLLSTPSPTRSSTTYEPQLGINWHPPTAHCLFPVLMYAPQLGHKWLEIREHIWEFLTFTTLSSGLNAETVFKNSCWLAD